MDTFGGLIQRISLTLFGLILMVKGVGILWTTDAGFFSIESGVGSLLISAAIILFNTDKG